MGKAEGSNLGGRQVAGEGEDDPAEGDTEGRDTQCRAVLEGDGLHAGGGPGRSERVGGWTEESEILDEEGGEHSTTHGKLSGNKVSGRKAHTRRLLCFGHFTCLPPWRHGMRRRSCAVGLLPSGSWRRQALLLESFSKETMALMYS